MLLNGSCWSRRLRTCGQGWGPMRGGWMFIDGFSATSLVEHDLFRPAFARRSIKQKRAAVPRLRAGGKPASTPAFAGAGFRDHALLRAAADRDPAAGGLDRLPGNRQIDHLIEARLLRGIDIAGVHIHVDGELGALL